jgi:malate dehydrogenase (oxaloacetate-decarboxylating)
LLDVVRNAQPSILVGVSGQPGVFREEIIREMASHVDRPLIFPLSNPTDRSEATPEDLLTWTSGKALVGTGSPFPAVSIGGKSIHPTQTNNSYIVPGLALGILVSRATRVSDAMIMASATALAKLAASQQDSDGLLPPLSQARNVSLAVARAVGRQAIAEGLAVRDTASFEQELQQYVWQPAYPRYVRVDA